MGRSTGRRPRESAPDLRFRATPVEDRGPQRVLSMHDLLRYGRDGDRVSPVVDGYLNYYYFTSSPDPRVARMMLEKGINGSAEVNAPDGRRRPAIAIRSSPWKAGHSSNPWHDEFDLDHGHVRYYGDHKPSTVGLPGATVGNRQLLEAFELHSAPSRDHRLAAPPLFLFRSHTVQSDRGAVFKGHVEFCGVALIERLEHVVQRDPQTGRSFPNLVLDLAIVDLAMSDHSVDMRWLDDRRDSRLSAEESLRFAPLSWRRWVERGRSAIPQVRRRVLSSRVRSREQQLPDPGTDAAATLRIIYSYFADSKHSFEMLAAKVAAAALGGQGGIYHQGWLTRSGGDGGLDFVARFDVGPASGGTPLVVLGQAKCISPESSVSPDQVARVVARLRRGWVGVFVTTGTFSKQAQVEVIDDEYPLVLIPGRELADHVARIAAEDFDGDVAALLSAVSEEYATSVTYRRPDEVLSI